MPRFIPIKVRIKAPGSPKWSKNLARIEIQAGEDFAVDLARYITGDTPFTIIKQEGPDWVTIAGTTITGTAPDTAEMFTLTLTAENLKGDDTTTFKISVCIYLVPYTPAPYTPGPYMPGPYTPGTPDPKPDPTDPTDPPDDGNGNGMPKPDPDPEPPTTYMPKPEPPTTYMPKPDPPDDGNGNGMPKPDPTDPTDPSDGNGPPEKPEPPIIYQPPYMMKPTYMPPTYTYKPGPYTYTPGPYTYTPRNLQQGIRLSL